MIQLDGIYKVYAIGENDVAALDGIDLTIERGEFVSIMGQSGSGKSTLLHIIGCLDAPTQGTYLLEGNDVTDLPDGELSRIRNRHFGFIFQSYNLLPELTAQENVEQPLIYAGIRARERRERALAMLDRVGLSDRVRHLPSQLSGGQQQRVAIARALVNDPTLLLADEPTGNLNTEAGDQVLGILAELHRDGTSILMVTHDPRIAGLAERKVVLQDGLVIEDGPVLQRTLVGVAAVA
ncbi:MAG: ABC transporter ATP-binding protein [Trueperaceae bacterium]|nr:ABC transporter ATP-binding protein [Trueperaceae bacterium]